MTRRRAVPVAFVIPCAKESGAKVRSSDNESYAGDGMSCREIDTANPDANAVLRQSSINVLV
ncbi:MAG: hypothetical protein AAF662_15085 [Pseudomonadota bacterium]